LAYNGTWIEGTFDSQPGTNSFPNTPLTASINFTGIAVYVYCIVANTNTNPDGFVDLTFFLDDDFVGNFINPPSPSGLPPYLYNVLVYGNDSLPDGIHTIRLQNGYPHGPMSLLLFDYLTYTYDDSKSTPTATHHPPTVSGNQSVAVSSSSKASRAKVVGAIFGTIGGLLLIVGLIFLIIYKRKSQVPFTNVKLPSKLPFIRWFQRRGDKSPSIPSAVRPSFNPSLLVQRIVPPTPTPPSFTTATPHPYASNAAYNHRVSPATGHTDTVELQRRQDLSYGGIERITAPPDIQERHKRNGRGITQPAHPKPSLAPAPLPLDISSHFDKLSEEEHAPPVSSTITPGRRFTVRNK
jgi:hypothetical protein